ncbi:MULTISPECIES: hypothetical protein [unclassified Streptomyces]|uniref:hypothetical protein n=1 Tax=unclassified Streptomyces TaxID=2593676 RepID=UPI00332166A6
MVQHTRGGASAAASWVWNADLSQDHKRNYSRFIERFPLSTFTRDTEDSLDATESNDGVALPPHLRRLRSALAFVHPPLLVQFDSYDYNIEMSEVEVEIWYALGLGQAGDETRAAFLEHAHGYVVGGWHGSDDSYLMVDIRNMDDERIFECGGDDLAYAVEDGSPVKKIVKPAFASYSSMLSHIVAMRTWQGEITRAR